MGYIGHTPNWTAPTSAPPISGADLTDDSVESGKIKAGTIVDSDINASAAIVTSKVSGAVTSITSHGLATSATTDTTNADNIGSGTIAEARLATLDASKLTGTVADARFPTTLPAASGANLTAIPAANISGVVPAANLGTGSPSSTTFLNGSGAYSEAGGGAWEIIDTSVADNSASLTVTGLTSAYYQFAICLSGLRFNGTHSGGLSMRFGDSSGIDSASGDYAQVQTTNQSNNTGYENKRCSTSQTYIELNSSSGGSGSGTGGIHPTSGMYYLTTQGGTVDACNTIVGQSTSSSGSSVEHKGQNLFGWRTAPMALTQVQVYPDSSSTITTGRMTIWGIAHV